jgi:Mg2+/Co2+ transporter CorB
MHKGKSRVKFLDKVNIVASAFFILWGVATKNYPVVACALLACFIVVFSHIIVKARGSIRVGYITRPTPEIFVKLFGMLFHLLNFINFVFFTFYL